MEIEFDPDKDRINQIKHGISLAAAADIDLDAARAVRLSDLAAQHRAQGALKWARDLGQRITPTFESN